MDDVVSAERDGQKSGNRKNQMRKQQCRMASGGGGAPDWRTLLRWNWFDTVGSTTCINTSAIVDATNGCTDGNSGFCSEGSSGCALAWQRPGWTTSICSQSGMSAMATGPALTDMDAAGASTGAFGQTYPASTSCMKSMLMMASSAPMTREGRRIVMVVDFLARW